MIKKVNFSKLHRKVSPILFLPLLVTGLTGMVYRIGRNRFGLPKEVGSLLLRLHDGRIVSDRLAPLYVLLLGIGLMLLLVTGIFLFFQRIQRQSIRAKSRKLSFRAFHRVLAPISFVPLLISAITGVIYRVAKAWLGLEDKYVKILLRIHEGSYLRPKLHLAYIFLMGVGLIGLSITGIQMSGIFRKSATRSTQP